MYRLAHETDYNNEEGVLVTLTPTFMNEVIEILHNEHGPRYGYCRGKKISSKMSEDEIYKTIYGSKENHDKLFPYGENSEEGIETLKKERFDNFYNVCNDTARKEIDDMVSKGEPKTVDAIGADLVLALSAGASFDEIYSLIQEYGAAGDTFGFYINYVIHCSKQGQEFKEYLEKKEQVKHYL